MPTFIFKISPQPADFHTENEKFRFDFFLIKTRKHQKKTCNRVYFSIIFYPLFNLFLALFTISNIIILPTQKTPKNGVKIG